MTKVKNRVTKRAVKINHASSPANELAVSRQSMRIATNASIKTAQQHVAALSRQNNRAKKHRALPPVTKSAAPKLKLSPTNSPPRTKDVNWNGIPSSRKGWYYIRNIVAQAGKDDGAMYLVEWEGIDPMTGSKWPSDWVKAKDVSQSAIRFWEKAKVQGRVQHGVLVA